jgi:hypothetical protein
MRYKVRNWIAVSAWNRNGGIHARSTNEPRGGQRNIQREYLEEYENELEFIENEPYVEDLRDCWD